MQRIDGPTVAVDFPAPEATGTGSSAPGYFTRGDPIAGRPPTTLDADWANMVQEEVLAPVLAAGLTPDKADHGQLLAALEILFLPAGGATKDDGQITIPLPGGWFVKVGVTPIGSGSNVVQGEIAFARPFPKSVAFIGGGGDGAANSQWHPIVVTFDKPSTAATTYTADSANTQQAIAAGRSIRWLAIGN